MIPVCKTEQNILFLSHLPSVLAGAFRKCAPLKQYFYGQKQGIITLFHWYFTGLSSGECEVVQLKILGTFLPSPYTNCLLSHGSFYHANSLRNLGFPFCTTHDIKASFRKRAKAAHLQASYWSATNPIFSFNLRVWQCPLLTPWVSSLSKSSNNCMSSVFISCKLWENAGLASLTTRSLWHQLHSSSQSNKIMPGSSFQEGTTLVFQDFLFLKIITSAYSEYNSLQGCT